jgi:hypothetical protein
MTHFGLVLSACLALQPDTFASSVPRFRYASEHCQPSKYELGVYHKRPLRGADRNALGRFDVEIGPPPRVVAKDGSATPKGRGAIGTDATAADLRSPPPAGYSAAELRPAADQPTRRSPLLRLATLAAGVVVVITGYWAFRGRRSAAPEQ